MEDKNIKDLMAQTDSDTPNEVDEHIESEYGIWPSLSSSVFDSIPFISNFMNAATCNSEVDPMALLITLLTAFGAAVGSEPHVKMADTLHPPRLYAVLVGASSRARKGTSLGLIKKLINLAEEYAALPKLKITHGPLSSGEGLVEAVRDASDTDPGVDDKRLWCIEEEFANVLQTNNRSGNTLSCILRTSWDSGGTIEPLTRHNRVRSTNPHISILGHITQHELTQALNKVETWNGFANRFLWVCVQRKREIAFPSSISESAMKELSIELGKLLNLASTFSEVSFTPGAKEFWSDQYSALSCDLPGRLGAITARSEAQTIRLALSCALLDGKDKIDIVHIQIALAIWRYCSDSAKFLFGSKQADPDLQLILQALSTGHKNTTQLHALFGNHKSKEFMRDLLNQLQTSRKIIGEHFGGGQGKGKAATIWKLLDK